MSSGSGSFLAVRSVGRLSRFLQGSSPLGALKIGSSLRQLLYQGKFAVCIKV